MDPKQENKLEEIGSNIYIKTHMVFLKLAFTEIPKNQIKISQDLEVYNDDDNDDDNTNTQGCCWSQNRKKSKGQMVYIGDQMKYFTLLEQSKTKMNESMAQQ